MAEGEVVEYMVEHGNGGITKALDVAGPDGAFVQGNSGGGGGGRGGGGYGGGSGWNKGCGGDPILSKMQIFKGGFQVRDPICKQGTGKTRKVIDMLSRVI